MQLVEPAHRGPQPVPKSQIRSHTQQNSPSVRPCSWWNRRIANPIKFYGYEGRGRAALMILKHQILPKLLLRRTKLDCAEDLALPPRRLQIRKDPFDAQEADFYEALYTQSQAAFGGCAAVTLLF